MDIKNSVPMRLLAAEKIKHPYFFKRIEQLVRDKEAAWDLTYCYCPIWVGMSYVLKLEGLKEINIMVSSEGAKLATLISWRQSKNIYEIDEGLIEEFVERSDGNMEITSDMLVLPTWCIYLKIPLIAEFSGAFVMFDEHESGGKELFIAPVTDDCQFVTAIYLKIPKEPRMLSDIIKEQFEESVGKGNTKEYGFTTDDVQRYYEDSMKTIKLVINILMYMSAVNAEIVFKNERSYKVTKKIKDTPREVKTFTVGEKTGYRIRTLKKAVVRYNESQSSGGHHRSPVMHVRRAHYHTFLCGKGRKGKRLKWLPPVIVNGNQEPVDIVTITKVKKE